MSKGAICSGYACISQRRRPIVIPMKRRAPITLPIAITVVLAATTATLSATISLDSERPTNQNDDDPDEKRGPTPAIVTTADPAISEPYRTVIP
ncbi:hypothetical protein Barb4_04301 [Bacteroidales bacterium Barb4]|nr:hypothetical protein Barb4_04301 [Bacteroidales bacterium Barb4]